jgi:uncharacterized protein (DUF736 family)
MPYDNKNSFVLFSNKGTNPKAPNFTGTFTDLNGKEWEISAWNKTSKNGNQFLSGKVSEKRERKAYPSKPAQNQFEDEDINF